MSWIDFEKRQPTRTGAYPVLTKSGRSAWRRAFYNAEHGTWDGIPINDTVTYWFDLPIKP